MVHIQLEWWCECDNKQYHDCYQVGEQVIHCHECGRIYKVDLGVKLVEIRPYDIDNPIGVLEVSEEEKFTEKYQCRCCKGVFISRTEIKKGSSFVCPYCAATGCVHVPETEELSLEERQELVTSHCEVCNHEIAVHSPPRKLGEIK